MNIPQHIRQRQRRMAPHTMNNRRPRLRRNDRNSSPIGIAQPQPPGLGGSPRSISQSRVSRRNSSRASPPGLVALRGIGLVGRGSSGSKYSMQGRKQSVRARSSLVAQTGPKKANAVQPNSLFGKKAQKITPEDDEEGCEFASLFELIDTNHDGYVVLDELIEFFELHGSLMPNDYKDLQELVLAKTHLEVDGEMRLGMADFKELMIKLKIFGRSSEKLDISVGNPAGLALPVLPIGGLSSHTESKQQGKKKALVVSDAKFIKKGDCTETAIGGPADFNIPWYILEPDKPKHLAWDFIILVLLSYTITVTPVRIGFAVQSAPLSFDFFVETVIDLVFCMDVFINFFTAYTREDGYLVHDMKLMASHYLRSWFLCDIVSSIPFDLVSVLLSGDPTESVNSVTTSSKTLKTVKIMKVLKWLKLSKMLRLVRAYKVSVRLEDELDLVGRVPLRIFKIVASTMFMSHIFACGWAGMARISGDREYQLNSWASMWGVVNAGFTKEYLSALYWAVTTLTTVGYGDISPRGDAEVIYASLAMIVGGAFYGYIIAMLAAMMQGLDANARIYHERMDAIVSYMRQRRFPRLLFRKVSGFYRHYYQQKTAFDESSLLQGLSRTLQQDVAQFLADDIFSKSYLLNSLMEVEPLMSLLQTLIPIKGAMNEVIFDPGEPGEEMFFITMGNIFAFDQHGRVLLEYSAGAVFGEFTALGLIAGRMYHTQCRDMVEMCSITYEDLKDALSPDELKAIRARAQSALDHLSKKLGYHGRKKALQLLKKRNSMVDLHLEDLEKPKFQGHGVFQSASDLSTNGGEHTPVSRIDRMAMVARMDSPEMWGSPRKSSSSPQLQFLGPGSKGSVSPVSPRSPQSQTLGPASRRVSSFKSEDGRLSRSNSAMSAMRVITKSETELGLEKAISQLQAEVRQLKAGQASMLGAMKDEMRSRNNFRTEMLQQFSKLSSQMDTPMI